MRAWFFFWLQRCRRKPQLSHWHVEFFTRQGCPLCEEAWKQVVAWQKEYGFTLTEHDIDRNPEWKSRFDTCVPVVSINGKVRFRGRVNAVLWRRLVAAASS